MFKKEMVILGLLNFFLLIPAQANEITSFVAVGRDRASSAPLLISSIDNGNTWETKYIPNLPANSDFRGASCTGINPNALCVAAGTTYDAATISPPIAISNDAGKTWQTKYIPNLPLSYGFAGTRGVYRSPSKVHDLKLTNFIAMPPTHHQYTIFVLVEGVLTG